MKSWAIYIVGALGFAIYGVMTEVDRDSTGAIVEEGRVDAFQIRVGDCFDDSSLMEGEFGEESESSGLPGVPCGAPHDNEAYAVFDLTIESYPAGDGMGELANTSCTGRFESFVGRDYESSQLEILALYPSVESWQQSDREVVCAVYDMDANKLVGSVKGQAL